MDLNAIHGAVIRGAFDLTYGRQLYGRHAAFLNASQWWSRAELDAYQNVRLQKLVAHAYGNVPFYRARFEAAQLKPGDFQSPADLKKLPLLTKREIQDHGAEMLARGLDSKQLRDNHSGGSTGKPLKFYQDDMYYWLGQAELLRNYQMAGYALGMRWAFLWGSDFDARVHKGWRGKFQDQLIYNLLWINTFDLTLDTLTQAARDLAAWKPQMIVAYVSSATLLARLVNERGIRGIYPHAMQTSAEVLSPDARDLLRSTFGCQVFDRYGCREVGNIAHECDAHQGLHLLMETNLVELVDDFGNPVAPGELGRIVVTNLNNYSMPFIRYEIGDMAVASDAVCRCGRGLPLLDAVIGRSADVITSPSGKLLHGEFFTHLFYKLDGIYQFRVVQETRENLRIQIVPAPGFQQDRVFQFLETTIHQYGDAAFRIHFELVDTLPPAASGKFRFTISNVPLALTAKHDQSIV